MSAVMSKIEIMEKLRDLVDHHLFEAPWPAEEDDVSAFLDLLQKMGLDETVPEREGATRYTALGVECEAELVCCFIGAHDPAEIPDILERHELVDEAEVDALYSLADEDDYLKAVEELLRRLYPRLFGKLREH